jgi:hypothetical protein
MQSIVHPLAVAGIEPYASHLAAAPEDLIQTFLPEEISVVVVGGGTQPTWKLIGGPFKGKTPTSGARLVSVDEWR